MKKNGIFILVQRETVDIKIINTTNVIAINGWAYVYNFSIGKRHLGDNDAFGKRGRLDEVIANDYFPSIYDFNEDDRNADDHVPAKLCTSIVYTRYIPFIDFHQRISQ